VILDQFGNAGAVPCHLTQPQRVLPSPAGEIGHGRIEAPPVRLGKLAIGRVWSARGAAAGGGWCAGRQDYAWRLGMWR
jgi:hypothetical protein